ncbi:maleate cis-trans isomerase family protein [Anaerotruncus rubiinfantis]|uniref:maleate cis-trans isomerase family protein n=1 Tax=Anaerotruncus rubiinfantis TaxID=1720200 RepID=UPI00189C0CA1|nr:aspartate/glutamate racemase family protein [Anaerotruncus rubiinfantis]
MDRKIGLISPGSPGGGGIKNPEEEMRSHLPAGYALITELVELFDMGARGIRKFSEAIDGAASRLAAQGVELIVFCCTSGSFIGGIGYDRAVSERLEQLTGVRTVTTTTAVLAALAALDSHKLVMATPYPDSVNRIEYDFFTKSGYEVLALKGMNINDIPRVPQIPIEEIRALVREVFTPEADTIFISCAGFKVLDHIESIEAEFGRPVVTSNQCTLWHILNTLELPHRPPLGKLFMQMAPSPTEKAPRPGL